MRESNYSLALDVLAGAPTGGMTREQIVNALSMRGRYLNEVQAKSIMGNMVYRNLADRLNPGEFPARYGIASGDKPRVRRSRKPVAPPLPRRGEANPEWRVHLRTRLAALADDLADIRAHAAASRASMDVCLGLDSVLRGVDRVRREVGH